MKKNVKLTLLFVVFTHFGFGQIWQPNLPCIEEFRQNPFHRCDAPFDPVCGCDLFTYRNQCEAFNMYGLNRWESGVCPSDLFYWDIQPNLVVQNMRFSMRFSARNQGPVTFQIWNYYGEIVLSKNYTAVRSDMNFFDDLNMVFLTSGVYFVVVQSGGYIEVKKMVKIAF